MNRNIGNGDRILRVIAGLLILTAGVYFKSYWGIDGLIPLLIAVMAGVHSMFFSGYPRKRIQYSTIQDFFLPVHLDTKIV